MRYYKIIEDGKVIDVNYVFLKYQAKHRILLGCDPSEAMFIQSSDQETVWRADWLIPPPKEAGDYPFADAVEISAEEYTELKEQLDEGNEMPEPEPDPEPDTDDSGEQETPEPGETVMSTAEMRRIIVEQAEKIKAQDERMEFIEDCLIEMSEVVYNV